MGYRSITDMPAAADMVRFREGTGQRFVVTVDAEEEFDWSKPLEREGFGLHHLPRLAKFQQFCESNGVAPIYLVDYPLATSELCGEILRDAIAAGRAEVGVQLHPWVNPPFDETVNEHNSFAGNLPEPLEREKFKRLRDEIERNFGASPLAYRAGRYGVGPNTLPILRDCGIAVDTSVRSNFDYSSTGGACFRGLPLSPWWLDGQRRIIEMPLTTVFQGPLRHQAAWLYPRMWRVPRLRGLLARLGLLDRIPLTPEGVTQEEALRGIKVAIDDGLPILVFSFHSPSLAPGYTPYVRSEADLDAFYDWWRAAFAALKAREVAPTGIRGIIDSVALA